MRRIRNRIRDRVAARIKQAVVDKVSDWVPYAIVVGFVAVALTIGFWEIELEKRAYNRLTGGNATWWDAAVLDLRIIGTPPKSENEDPQTH